MLLRPAQLPKPIPRSARHHAPTRPEITKLESRLFLNEFVAKILLDQTDLLRPKEMTILQDTVDLTLMLSTKALCLANHECRTASSRQ